MWFVHCCETRAVWDTITDACRTPRESDMVRAHRFSTTVVLVCFVMVQSRGAFAAGEQPPLPSTASTSTLVIDTVADRPDVTSAINVATADQPLDRETDLLQVAQRPRFTLSDEISRERLFPGIADGNVWRGMPTFFSEEGGSLAQRRGYRGRGSGRNDGARAAVLLGAVGVIAGTAVLVYTNRPECSVSARTNGCGYGTKVAGSAVLSAGLVGLLVGALTWR